MRMTKVARRRKPPVERRADIVAAAAQVALAEGLQCCTLRRVAEVLGVAPGLVNHYFPAVDDLAAAAFAEAAAAEREAAFAALPHDAGPMARMRALLAGLLDESGDALSLLWLDAWQASRNRPALRAEVARQMAAWQGALERAIREGRSAGAFRVAAPEVAALRILALVDGLSVQAAIRLSIDYDLVREMVVAAIERELGTDAGALGWSSGAPRHHA